jgi:hypothetical protein
MELPQLWHLRPTSRKVIIFRFTSGPMEKFRYSFSLVSYLIFRAGLYFNDTVTYYVDLGKQCLNISS